MTYDPNNAGSLERITQEVAVTLDEIRTWIRQVTDVLNPDYATDEQLPILSSILGLSPDREDDPVFVRKQIRTAIDFYRNKGTITSFRVLFYNLGFNVDIVPLWTPDLCEEVTGGQYILADLRLVNDEVVPYEENVTPITVTNPDLQSDIYVTPLPPC